MPISRYVHATCSIRPLTKHRQLHRSSRSVRQLRPSTTQLLLDRSAGRGAVIRALAGPLQQSRYGLLDDRLFYIFIHRHTWGECPHLPRGVRTTQARGRITPGLDGIVEANEQVTFPPLPVTVTQLPVTRCEISHRTVAYRPGSLSGVLTALPPGHPEALGVPLSGLRWLPALPRGYRPPASMPRTTLRKPARRAQTVTERGSPEPVHRLGCR